MQLVGRHSNVIVSGRHQQGRAQSWVLFRGIWERKSVSGHRGVRTEHHAARRLSLHSKTDGGTKVVVMDVDVFGLHVLELDRTRRDGTRSRLAESNPAGRVPAVP